MLTEAQKKQIAQRVEECYAKCEQHYGVTFVRPTQQYAIRGTTGGKAFPTKNELHWHPVLAAQNWEDYYQNTVPHEVAHLIDYKLNPSNFTSRIVMTSRGYRRSKRELHGPTWKSIMRVLGANPTRCHDYDTTDVARRKSRHQYVCACGREYNLGPKYHSNIQTGRRHYKCKTCSASSRVWKHQSSAAPKRPQLAVAAQAPTPPKAPRMGTKLDHACNIVATHNFMDAGSYIAIIMRDLGMSKAGATTYYYQAKKRLANNS